MMMEREVDLLLTGVEIMKNERRHEVEGLAKKRGKENSDFWVFFLDKYYSILGAFESVATSIMENKSPDGRQPLLALNILEAVKLDIFRGHNDNARLGLHLAITGSHVWPNVQEAWNFAFVAGSVEASRAAKLLIPVTMCTASSDPSLYIQRRVILLALALMHHYSLTTESSDSLGISKFELHTLLQHDHKEQTEDLFVRRFDIAELLGSTIQHKVKVTIPSKDSVERVLYNLCNEHCHKPSLTNLPSSADQEAFQVYTGFVTWITVMVTGFGSEISFFMFYLLKSGWTLKMEILW
eukprot:CAMPEP_0178905412 /NCGR_PEP_ID=MMETSP0786-20121207/6263_1 /TAXON_ID=186022 /ORGANISM="Thalassionema frauenfeldii, Strain CCMP 1798" /LENGTH=295 /DNA_ID=CAMNT_0020577021 /DNA_START=983 /DNA_END=1868 /DNA_ORIENTATION=+